MEVRVCCRVKGNIRHLLSWEANVGAPRAQPETVWVASARRHLLVFWKISHSSRRKIYFCVWSCFTERRGGYILIEKRNVSVLCSVFCHPTEELRLLLQRYIQIAQSHLPSRRFVRPSPCRIRVKSAARNLKLNIEISLILCHLYCRPSTSIGFRLHVASRDSKYQLAYRAHADFADD